MPLNDESQEDQPLDEETREALEAAVPPRQRGLRATRSYLLPGEVRLGLELALRAIHDGLMHEGMHELEGSPIEELGHALAEDLEAALGAAEELLSDASGTTLSQDEIRITAATEPVRDSLRRSLRDLRRALDHPEAGERDAPESGETADAD